jgi:hypothetical protein
VRCNPSVLLVLASCTGDGPLPTDETGLPADTSTPGAECAEEVHVTYAEGGCFGYPDQWDFKVDVEGCAETAVLDLWDTVALDWDEEHSLAVGAVGPDRIWQNWILGPLPHATPRDQWQAGANTAFDCYAQSSNITFAARLFDADGAQMACSIWGHDPDAVLAGAASTLHVDPAAVADCQVEPF